LPSSSSTTAAIARLDEFAAHFDLSGARRKLAHLDFCALAQAQGVEAVRVVRCSELDAALRQAFSATRPFLVEVCVAA
jgi:benzoylformate decarboxylase